MAWSPALHSAEGLGTKCMFFILKRYCNGRQFSIGHVGFNFLLVVLKEPQKYAPILYDSS